MTTDWRITFAVAPILIVTCFGASFSGVDKSGSGGSVFGSGGVSPSFQSWSDWVKKRNLHTAPWTLGDFSGDKFQQWQDWVYKRGYPFDNKVEFGDFRPTNLQGWKDWMSKRGMMGELPFSPFGSSRNNGGQFQKWSDWMKKRGFDNRMINFGSNPTNSKFQSWSNFNKRSEVSSDPPFPPFSSKESTQFQTWHDWAKRKMGTPSSVAFGSGMGDQHRYMNWSEFFKKNASKRQLGYMPGGFGSYSRYFTDGLQDWRSTFKSDKREKQDDSQKAGN